MAVHQMGGCKMVGGFGPVSAEEIWQSGWMSSQVSGVAHQPCTFDVKIHPLCEGHRVVFERFLLEVPSPKIHSKCVDLLLCQSTTNAKKNPHRVVMSRGGLGKNRSGVLMVTTCPPLANSRVSARRSPGWGGETVAK